MQPKKLQDQTAVGGKLVIPVGDDILEMTKTPTGRETRRHPGFFVRNVVSGAYLAPLSALRNGLSFSRWL